MILYIKNSEGNLKETTLFNILIEAFNIANFKMDNGSFESENHNWIGVV